MANLMVRELELNEDMDRKALVNIVGGFSCLDLMNEKQIDCVDNGLVRMMTFDGGCTCVGTQLDTDDNRLKQIWKTRRYEVYYKSIDCTYLADFCAVGCP
ncbi:MAG: hypothetical protein V2I97_05340 [Desulfococcaceae bacterium]|nr:hypothetical protein [Desulfococcaceae bacterium]